MVFYFDPNINPIASASIIGGFAIFGLFINLTAAFFLLKVRNMQNTLGFLMVNDLLANSGGLVGFLFMVVPAILLPLDDKENRKISKTIGQICNFFYYVAMYTRMWLTINRFFAVNFPVKYKTLFVDSRFKYFMVSSWLLAVPHAFIYFLPGCYLIFHADTAQFEFALTKCGNIIGFWVDFVFCMSAGGFFLCLDLYSLFKIKRILNCPKEQVNCVTNIRDKQQHSFRLLLQIVTVQFALCTTLVSFHVLSTLHNDKWYLFVTVTMAWEGLYVCAGPIVLIYNRELRRTIVQFVIKKKKQIPMLL